MHRIIIADDEPWVVYRLSHLVDYAALGFEVIATAADGFEALTLCKEKRPDAILTDIRMPGLDGLELLGALKPSGIEVVLVSGYAEFSYAQQAVRDGAFDYLIKQVSAEQLSATLTRLKQKLDAARERIDAQGAFDTLFSFLGDDGSPTIEEWLETVRPELKAPFYRVCTFIADGEALPEDWVAFSTGKKKLTALVGCGRADEKPFRACPCGVSAAGTGGDALFALFWQSNVAYCTTRFLGLEQPVVYDAFGTADIESLMGDMERALREGTLARCQSALDALETAAKGMNAAQIAVLYNRLSALFNRYREADCFSGADMDYLRLIQEFETLHEMFSLFRASLEDEDPREPPTIEKVLQYVDAAYGENLRISELAEKFHFSPSYLSTLFHKQVGMPFTKYLARRRMSRAMELMRNERCSLQEIAERSGYGDYFQFTKTFKKFAGVTPGQYRKRLAAAGDVVNGGDRHAANLD